MNTAAQATDLVEHLTALGPLAVAFSGGTDSSLVLAAATRAVGTDNVLAITANSPSLAATELTDAHRIATNLGVQHLTPPTNELDQPGYTANGRNRCYFCKPTILTTAAAAPQHRLPAHTMATHATEAP